MRGGFEDCHLTPRATHGLSSQELLYTNFCDRGLRRIPWLCISPPLPFLCLSGVVTSFDIHLAVWKHLLRPKKNMEEPTSYLA